MALRYWTAAWLSMFWVLLSSKVAHIRTPYNSTECTMLTSKSLLFSLSSLIFGMGLLKESITCHALSIVAYKWWSNIVPLFSNKTFKYFKNNVSGTSSSSKMTVQLRFVIDRIGYIYVNHSTTKMIFIQSRGISTPDWRVISASLESRSVVNQSYN